MCINHLFIIYKYNIYYSLIHLILVIHYRVNKFTGK